MKTMQLAIRTLTRFKLYTTINILGLALSLACTILILRYVYQELTVNHFIKNLDRMYLTVVQNENDNKKQAAGITNIEMEDGAFVNPLNSPFIEKSTSFRVLLNDDISTEGKKFNVNVYVTDTNFLKIVNFPLIQGSVETILSSPENAVITQMLARKIFGKQNPMGKTLTHSTGKVVTIAGIIGEPHTKSSFIFDLLISSDLQKYWSWTPHTIALTIPGADINKLNKQNENFMNLNSWMNKIRYQFYPLQNIYLDKSVEITNLPKGQGNYGNIVILLIVAGLILIIGVFNFINIYTVLMLKRAREFGLKKVFGGQSGHILGQLFTENIAMIGVALCLGWTFIEITNSLVEKTLGIPQLPRPSFDIMLSVCLLILLPIATSIYPFIRSNYATPISSLKSVNIGGNSIVSRTLFLVIQYIITFSLIVIAIFFIKQLHFMLNADLGFRSENIIKVQFFKPKKSAESRTKESIQELQNKVDNLKHLMDESPLFTNWLYGSSPNELTDVFIKFKTLDGDFKKAVYGRTSEKYFKMYDFKLKEGRIWNDTIDLWDGYNFIINETAQKLFEITSIDSAFLVPEHALWWTSEAERNQNLPYRIVGIIKDFKGTHLSKATPPIIMCYNQGWITQTLTAAIVNGKRKEAIAFLKKLHDDIVGGEFEYTFLEDEIKEMYHEDKKVASIYSTFALIAILISSLGLFGLSLFDIQQRYREIALRKVNGAQVNNILWILLHKYFILLGISFLVAIPMSYIAIHKYLEDFVNKAEISWWIFAIAALITSGVSLLTLIFQIRKAANSNPGTILKGE